MANIKVSVINACSVLTDQQIEQVLPAFEVQVSDHFAPAWGIDADLAFVGRGKRPARGSWWLTILDNTDKARATGYHEVTSEGLPLGKSFAETDMKFGEEWTVTATHELLEMLADPDISTAASSKDFLHHRGPTVFFAREVCDPCHTDQDAYRIGEVPVTDFVFPAWFESFRKPESTQFDYRRKMKEPFELLPGGYIAVLNPRDRKGWTQITNDASQKDEVRVRGSRLKRRTKARSRWRTSEVFL